MAPIRQAVRQVQPDKTQVPQATSSWRDPFTRIVALLILVSFGMGCGSNGASNPTSTSTTSTNRQSEGQPATAEAASKTDDANKPKRRTFAPVDLSAKSNEKVEKSSSENLESVRSALKPFQVLLGRWNGLSHKKFSDQPQWAYDWVTDPKQPSLRITSETSVYIREGRLTYLPESDQFQFTSIDADGAKHTFVGTFTEPIRDVAGDEKKPQRTYKLQLTESAANSDGEQWRITFNQPENNRYMLELDRKRGAGQFTRVDTVHTQREGTSFAVSDTDYGEKTCIISQGLGTISVSYKGQSFWVCCSGCKAAFDENPEKWIAKWEEKKKSMNK